MSPSKNPKTLVSGNDNYSLAELDAKIKKLHWQLFIGEFLYYFIICLSLGGIATCLCFLFS